MDAIIENKLKESWEELKAKEPKIRIRNAAQQLGCSELELLLLNDPKKVIDLGDNFIQILQRVPDLGYVMALTRNDSVVHERKGEYKNPQFGNPHVGLFVGEDIDLRVFLNNWKFSFAVTEFSRGKERQSLQFFNRFGTAIHKIYLTEKSHSNTFKGMISEFEVSRADREYHIITDKPKKQLLQDNEVDLVGFHEGWLNLTDTHDFFLLMGRFKLTRTQALRLAPTGNYAVQIPFNSIRIALEKSVKKDLDIMVFVGNDGMLQIHTGKVNNLVDSQGWFNVMDPEFNLHIKEEEIKETWIVRKPTSDGIVTSIEAYDGTGNLLLTLFGKRKPGMPELEEWRGIVKEIELSSI